MVSTPYSLTETWTPTNSSAAAKDCDMLLSNVSASDIRWARSSDGNTPPIAPVQAHILRPGRSQNVPLAEGETIWMAGSPRGAAALDVFDNHDAPMVSRSDLAARVSGGLSGPDGEVIWAGKHAYAWQSGANVIADLPGIVPLAPFHLEQWGVATTINTAGAVTADHSAELQSAHDYIAGPLVGGGDLYVSGEVGIGSTVYLGELGYFGIIGNGRGTSAGSKFTNRVTSGTRLAWTGAAGGTMIKWTADRNETGAADPSPGGEISEIHFDGQESAGTGLFIESAMGLELKIRTSYFTTAHVVTHTLDNGLPNSPEGNQRGQWSIHCDDVLTSNEPAAQLVLNGSGVTSTNTSLFIIQDLQLRAESTAVAAHIASADGLLIQHFVATTRVSAVGDGGKVFFHSSDSLPDHGFGTVANAHARHIRISFGQFSRGVVAKDVITSGTPAHYITIGHISLDNGGQLPVCEAYEGQIRYMSSHGEAEVGTIRGIHVDRAPLVGGTADDITLDAGTLVTPSTIKPGTRVRFLPTAANSGATTIRLDSDSARSARTVTGAYLPAAYIRSGVSTEAYFDGSNWIVDRPEEFVSVASGHYMRYANGDLVCRMTLTLIQSDADTLSAACTYPAPFVSASQMIPIGSVNTSDFQSNVSSAQKEHITGVQFGVITSTDCNVFLNRVPGGNSFVSGDQTTVRLQFSGRWY